MNKQTTSNFNISTELNNLVKEHLYIAQILAKKYSNKGVDYDDIYQVACMGIVYASKRFDPDKGIKFSTFATHTVEGEILKYFRDKSSTIRIPRKLYELFFKAEKLKSQYDSECSDDEIAKIIGVDTSQIKEAYNIKSSTLSLDDDIFKIEKQLSDNYLAEDTNVYIKIEDKMFFDSCIEKLNPEEQDFIKLRYYDELSQKQISEKWNKSQMYVSRIERKILDFLRNAYFEDNRK